MEHWILSSCFNSVNVHFLMNCSDANAKKKVQVIAFFNYSKQSHCLSVQVAGIKLVFFSNCFLHQKQHRVKILKPVEPGSIWRKILYCARLTVSTFIDLFPFTICLPVFIFQRHRQKLAMGIGWQQHPGGVRHLTFGVHAPQQAFRKPRFCAEGKWACNRHNVAPPMSAALSLLSFFLSKSGDEHPESFESLGEATGALPKLPEPQQRPVGPT